MSVAEANTAEQLKEAFQKTCLGMTLVIDVVTQIDARLRSLEAEVDELRTRAFAGGLPEA